MASLLQTWMQSSHWMHALRSSTNSSTYARFFPVTGDSRLPPLFILMTCDGQMRSHARQAMHASSPFSSSGRAKLVR